MLVILIVMVILTGCTAQTFEKIEDLNDVQTMAQPATLLVDLPEEAAAPAMQGSSGTLYFCGDYDIIIEVHGIQHYWYLNVKTIYNRMNVNGRNGIEEHENDLIKYDLAVLHGYEYNKNYFVIDSRKSNIDYIRNSIDLQYTLRWEDLIWIILIGKRLINKLKQVKR